MRKLHVTVFVLGAAFLAWLIWSVGVRELGREVALLGWGLFPLILCEGFSEFIHVAGWRYCLSKTYRSLPTLLLFRIRMAGYAISYLTPTAAMGGEVTKATLLASHHRGPEAITGVLIGKACFSLSHLLFVVVGSAICLWRIDLPRPLLTAMMVSGGVIACGMVIFLWVQKQGKLGVLLRWLASRNLGGARMRQAAEAISKVDEALRAFYREHPGDLLKAVCWHQVGYSVGIFQTWLFFHLLHQPVSLALAAGLWCLGMWFDLLTFAVPMNVGTLEGTRVMALRAIGYSSLVGMTYGVALRFAQLCWSVLGLMLYACLVKQVTPGRLAVPTSAPGVALPE